MRFKLVSLLGCAALGFADDFIKITNGALDQLKLYENDPDVLSGFYAKLGKETQMMPALLEGSGAQDTKQLEKLSETFALAFNDAMEGLMRGLEASNGDLSDRRQRLREELARVRLDLPSSPVHLDRNRQAVRNVYLKRVARGGGRRAGGLRRERGREGEHGRQRGAEGEVPHRDRDGNGCVGCRGSRRIYRARRRTETDRVPMGPPGRRGGDPDDGKPRR